jgi:tetratricopeptide (TPR) repeat protein
MNTEQGKKLKIVVASPSDVTPERKAVASIVTELNQLVARHHGVYLELYRWETDTHPGFHPVGPQGLVDAVLQIHNCDLLVGIFWRKFGTPVADAASGTAHEFQIAYESWKKNGRPQIMMYFSEKPYFPKTKEETDQWGMVLKFRKDFPKEGLYWPFRSTAIFKDHFRLHLTQHILYPSDTQQPPKPQEQNQGQPVNAAIPSIPPRSPEYSLSARRILERAVHHNPKSAENFSLLANLLIDDYTNRWNEATISPEDANQLLHRADEAVQTALGIDSTLSMAYYADGLVSRAKGDHQRALKAFERSIETDQNFARAYAQKADELVHLGRPNEVAPLLKKAIELSPRDPFIGHFYWVAGRAAFMMGNYQEAISWLRKAVEARPDSWFVRAYLLSAYALTGRYDQQEVKTELEEYYQLFPTYTIQRMQELSTNELSNTDPNFRASVQDFYRGLGLVGMQ